MNDKELGILRRLIFPLVVLLLFFAALPVSAETLDERIKSLEEAQRANAEIQRANAEIQRANAEELARLKGDQMELKKEATAAAAALPEFRYRSGSGFRIRAADNDWEIRFFGRQMTYMSFFTDDNEPGEGAIQGAVQIRRFRPGFNFFWQQGFYEAKFQIDTQNGGGSNQGLLNAFDAEMFLHFEKVNPLLPTLGFGSSPSLGGIGYADGFSSKRGPRSERAFINEGIGFTTGSQDRGIVLSWADLPLFGIGDVEFLNFGFGMDGAGTNNQFARTFEFARNDSKSFTGSIGIEPFSKLKNKWLRGLRFSFVSRIKKQFNEGEGLNIRANQIRSARVEFIRSADLAGQQQYYHPAVAWKIGPNDLIVGGYFWNAHLDDGNFNEGGLIQARGIKVLDELWLWSPKGWLRGSPREGGVSVVPLWQRADVDAPTGGLENCGCNSAHVTNAGVGLWYYFPGDVWNIGVVYDHWRVNNANGGSRGAGSVIEEGREGRTVNFNTVTLISRFHW
jgi:uncharacterized protein YdcH (DUF465 family)